jgi:hypothetical protein
MKTINFKFTEKQQQKFNEWDHICLDNFIGTIGGKLTFHFTPTGLGNCVSVTCICGKKLDLTEYEDW